MALRILENNFLTRLVVDYGGNIEEHTEQLDGEIHRARFGKVPSAAWDNCPYS